MPWHVLVTRRCCPRCRNLGYSCLPGSLPANGYVLPGTLEALYLTDNKITGTIPASWRLPDVLVEVIMYGNELTGRCGR